MTCCPVNDLQVEKEGSISDGDGEREVEERIKEEQGSEERRESDDGHKENEKRKKRKNVEKKKQD